MSIHAFYAFAFLVLTIGTGGVVLAQSQINAPADGTAVTTPAVAKPAHEATNAPAVNYQQSVCVISGTVQAVQMLEKSPWDDGTPSTLTTTEIRIAVALDNRSMQRGTQGSTDCTLPADKTPVLYKLCSPTQLKKGDRIKGVEGLATGTDQSLGCLFDVAVDSGAAKGQ